MKKKLTSAPQVKLIKLEAQKILAGSGDTQPEYGQPGAQAGQAKATDFHFEAFRD